MILCFISEALFLPIQLGLCLEMMLSTGKAGDGGKPGETENITFHQFYHTLGKISFALQKMSRVFIFVRKKVVITVTRQEMDFVLIKKASGVKTGGNKDLRVTTNIGRLIENKMLLLLKALQLVSNVSADKVWQETIFSSQRKTVMLSCP